jgi:signal transduction histidine kinase
MSSSVFPVRSRRRLGGSLSSLRFRVFLGVLLVGLAPVVGALIWGLLIQFGNNPTPSPPSGADHGAVVSAWDGSWAAVGVFPGSEVEADAVTMCQRLSSSDYSALERHVAALMAASPTFEHQAGIPAAQFVSESDAMAMHEVGGSRYMGMFSTAQLDELRTRGYYWGEATYWFPEPIDPDGRRSDVGMMGVPTPIVAWMPTPDTISFVQVQVDYTVFPDTPVPWWWLETVVLVGVGCVIILALAATLLATRGMLNPLRQMAAASGVAEAGGEPQPVRESGPREIRQLARVFNGMALRTSRAQEAEQSFLLSVSHELKTPLTAIKGYGETLAQGRAEPRAAGEVIVKEANRLQRLVQDVLDLARSRKSSFSVRSETVDLATVAHEVFERYAPRAQEYGLDLQVDADAPAPVSGDADRVLQVVSNLVENALRCTPAEGAVTIAVAPGELRVMDTGLGLTRDDLAHAFDRFYLYERYGRERAVGTGLGLAIVKNLTTAMGGSVQVESTLGVGTTFTLMLAPASGSPDSRVRDS